MYSNVHILIIDLCRSSKQELILTSPEIIWLISTQMQLGDL